MWLDKYCSFLLYSEPTLQWCDKEIKLFFHENIASSNQSKTSRYYTGDLLQFNQKYLEVPVPHGNKSFPIVRSNNTYPTQLDPMITNDLVP